MTTDGTAEDVRFTAAVDLIGRTGAHDFEIRIIEPDPDEFQIVVCIALARYAAGTPANPGTVDAYKTGAHPDPVRAVLRLAEDAVDGGACAHCSRPAGLDPEHFDGTDMPISDVVCWYRFDPSTNRFMRGCAS